MATKDPALSAAINPRVRKSPFFDATVEDGLAAVTSYNHMWMPTSYGNSAEEYRRLTEGVSMWDVAAQRHIEVTGPDADDLVDVVTTVDTSAVEPGSGVYAPMVDVEGTLINDPVLLRFDDGSWRFSISDSDVRLWVDAIAHSRPFDVRVRELDTATLAVQGPEANDVLVALGCEWVDQLEYFARRRTEIAGATLVVSRSGWSKEGGYELFLEDPELAVPLWRAVRDAGAAFDIGPGSPNQSERIENVLLSYGTDTGFGANPLEVGLGDHLDLDGRDFIGRDAVLAVRAKGPARHLLGAVVTGDPIEGFGHPTPIEIEGQLVGELRAAAWSPRFSRNLGLALVDAACPAHAQGRTQMSTGDRDMSLVELPFDDVA